MARSTSDEPHSIANEPAARIAVKPPRALARKVTLPLESEQERRERTYREKLQWALIAGAPQRRDGSIDGANLLCDIIAII